MFILECVDHGEVLASRLTLYRREQVIDHEARVPIRQPGRDGDMALRLNVS